VIIFQNRLRIIILYIILGIIITERKKYKYNKYKKRSKMVSTVQFLVHEQSCRPLHQNVAAAAMGLLVAIDSTISDNLGASYRSASHGDGLRPTSSSSANTHATASSAAETPAVSWRYTLSSEPNARTPFTPFSLPYFEAFAALVAGDAGIDNSTYNGRNIGSGSNQSKSSTSIPLYSWRNLTQDVLKALQFVFKSSDAVRVCLTPLRYFNPQ